MAYYFIKGEKVMKNRKSSVKLIVLSGLFIAIGIIFPSFFHFFKIGGQVALPMHIPVILGGYFLGPLYGLLVGILTPILSSVLTGMPPISPIPMAIIMTIELGVYGFLSGLLYKKLKQNIFLSLIVVMIAGRVAAGITVAVLVNFFSYKS